MTFMSESEQLTHTLEEKERKQQQQQQLEQIDTTRKLRPNDNVVMCLSYLCIPCTK